MATIRCDHCGAPLDLPAPPRPVVRCAYCQRDQDVATVAASVERPPHRDVERYAVGEPVVCEWRGRYWPATVLAVRPDGTYHVHYDGYSHAWDEDVGVDRLEPRGAASPATGRARTSTVWFVGLAVGLVVVVVGGVGAALVVGNRTPARLDPGAPTGSRGRPSDAPRGTTPLADAPTTPPLTSTRALKTGEPVLVFWGQSWWRAQVVEVQGPSTVLVHYDGWASTWDEPVDLSRVRLP